MTAQAFFALIALALAAFAFVTTEMLPIALLPQIATALHANAFASGLLVTVYAATVAFSAAPATAYTSHHSRKRVLSALLITLIATNIAAALAPTYVFLFTVRLVNAIAHGVFWSIVSSCATKLVPHRVQGSALAIVFSGASIASVLGVPAATLLGQHYGWRAAFMSVALLGCIVLGVLAICFRKTPDTQLHRLVDISRLFAISGFRALLITTSLIILGQFAAYTYIVPYMVHISGFPVSSVSPLLFLFGISGAVGNFGAGIIADKRPILSSLIATLLVALSMCGLIFAGHHRIVTTILLATWGAGAGGLAVGLQTRVLAMAPTAVDLASALFAGSYNVGIGGGALLGGIIVSAGGLNRVVEAGAALAMAALFVQCIALGHRLKSNASFLASGSE